MALDPLQVALWRFEQISPLLEHCLTHTQRSELASTLAARAVRWPSGDERPVARSTLYYWLGRYNNNPVIETLLPPTRQRHSAQEPPIRPEWVQYALALIEEEPARSLYVLCHRISLSFALARMPSRSSLHRALRRERRYASARQGKIAQRRCRFGAVAVHQIWQGDAKADFEVTFINGTTRRVRILSLIDDYSRYILAALVVDSESLVATLVTFQNAANRFGLPESFYSDRGSPYDSYLFRQGLGILGVRRINTKPRNPSAHGKIEAYHRSLERWFVKELPHQPLRDIPHLQLLLDAMISTLYHQHKHRELKRSPAEAFNNTISRRTVSLQRLHDAFLERHTLLPERKTGNVRLGGILFRTPSSHLIPRRSLRYAMNPLNPSVAYLVDGSGALIRLEPAVRVATPPVIAVDEAQLPLGSLSPLLEQYRGRTLQRPVPGFGLPEIYACFAQSLGRDVPHTEAEASVILEWLREHGPFEPHAFTAALQTAVKRLGCGRPLSSILEEITRHITTKGPLP